MEDEKFEVFMVLKFQVKVLRFMMPCSVVVGYKCFGGPCYLHLHPSLHGVTS